MFSSKPPNSNRRSLQLYSLCSPFFLHKGFASLINSHHAILQKLHASKASATERIITTKNQTTQKDPCEKVSKDKSGIKAGMPHSLLMAEGWALW